MINHLPILFILIAVALSALSGVPTFLFPRRSAMGQRIAAVFMGIATLIGLSGVALVFIFGTDSTTLPWQTLGTALPVQADALSAFFLVPVLVIGGLGSCYGLGYWPQPLHPYNGRGLSLFWGLTVAGMALLLIARHAVLFLIGWELMAVSAFFLITTEHEDEQVRSAGWVYFVATHLGSMALFGFFATLYAVTGSFELRPLAASEANLSILFPLFFLALVGFGTKAGIMPFHFWLPAGHANGPSHVSALLSGVMLKIGLYGIIRFVGFLPDPPVSWGMLILVLGCISGVLGVVFALGQHDLKRLLAYHSVENIGIILIGFGLAMIGRSWHQPLLVALGMAGCLLHIWNHALFKSLLFFSAGSVIHASGTREIDQMGGLAKAMPWTAALFLVGALAICGLPPLNGFISEWFIYLGLFHAAADGSSLSWTVTALAAPVLALIGALALACFVKAYGAVFLGVSRRPITTPPHEAPFFMKLPMLILAVCCFVIGLFPILVAPVLSQAIFAWDNGTLLDAPPALGTLTPLMALTLIGGVLLVLCFLLFKALARKIQWRNAPEVSTWGCGYAHPTPRMQYTSSSFAQLLVGLFRFVLRPHIHTPHIDSAFPEASHFESHIDEPVLDRNLLPMMHFFKKLFTKALPLQRGLTHQYLSYVALILLALMLWLMPFKEILSKLFVR